MKKTTHARQRLDLAAAVLATAPGSREAKKAEDRLRRLLYRPWAPWPTAACAAWARQAALDAARAEGARVHSSRS